MGLKARGFGCVAAGLALLSVVPVGMAQDKAAQAAAAASAKKDDKMVVEVKPATPAPVPPADSTTEGTVTVGGQVIAYKAVAGTLVVGSTDTQDMTLDFEGNPLPDAGVKPPDKDKPEEAAGYGADVLRGVLQEGCGGRAPAGDVSV